MRIKSLKFGNLLGKNAAAAPPPREQKSAEETAADIPEITDLPPRPHGPIKELSLEDSAVDTDEVVDFGKIDTDMAAVEPDDDEEITVVEVKAGELDQTSDEDVKPEEITAKEEQPAEDNAKPADIIDDSLTSLFSMDEEEVNPLASLINSLPDVTPQELLDDIQEIKEIIQEWRQH